MTKLPAPADIQQSGTATYTGRHRDPWNRHATRRGYEPRHADITRDRETPGERMDRIEAAAERLAHEGWSV